MYNGVNGGKIQAMGTSDYFIVRQVALLGVSDHCVKQIKRMPCPHDFFSLSPMEYAKGIKPLMELEPNIE